jgi:hypothetical protein
MQIEWSEAEELELAEVGTEAEKEVRERKGPGVDGRRRCESGREVGIGWGVERTGAKRGEPCRVCELWESSFNAAVWSNRGGERSWI